MSNLFNILALKIFYIYTFIKWNSVNYNSRLQFEWGILNLEQSTHYLQFNTTSGLAP